MPEIGIAMSIKGNILSLNGMHPETSSYRSEPWNLATALEFL